MIDKSYLADSSIPLLLLLLYLFFTVISGNPMFLLAGIIYIGIIFFTPKFFAQENKRSFYRVVGICAIFYSIYASLTHFVFVDDAFKEYFLAPDQLTFFKKAVKNSHFSFKQIWISAFDNKIEYTGSGYPFFTAYTGTLQKVISSTDSFGLLFQKLNVAFLGSFIPGIVYLLCNKITKRRKALKAAVIYGLFSINFIYSVVFLRDIHITLIYAIGLYLLIEAKPKIRIFLILLLLGLLAYYIRFENGLFFLLFIGVWVYKSGYNNKLILCLGITSIVMIIFSIGGDFIYNSVIERISTSNANIFNKEQQNSLYVQLMKLPVPANYLSVTAFGQLKPFPFWVAFEGWRDGIQALFFFPFAMAGFFWFSVWMRILRYPKMTVKFFNKYKLTVLIVIVYLIIVSIAQSEGRRLMAVYPIIFMAFIYISERLFMVKELLINASIYSLLLIIYFFL